MKPEDYEKRLVEAPAHDSPRFITWLCENNKVLRKTDYYVLIENCKYHTEEKPHYTIFSTNHPDSEWCIFQYLSVRFIKWEWLKKDEDRQTIKRFHIHLYRKNSNAKK